MEKVMTKKEIKIVAENTIGILAEVTSLIASNGVNIENICAYTEGGKAIFNLLTDNNEKIEKVLGGKGFHFEEREVIVLELWNRPGALSKAAAKFKEKGIHLQNVYGTSSPKGERTTIIFLSEDNEKASEIFDSMVMEET
jgi:hypothetical protein